MSADDRAWGKGLQGDTEVTINHARYMGGTFHTVTNPMLVGVAVHLGTGSGNIRLAVYQGGSLTDPSGASLIHDFGTGTATNGWLTMTVSPTTLTSGAITWIAWKADDNTKNILFTTSGETSWDFQSVRGRFESTAENIDETASWSSTIPSGGAFTDFWYPLRLIYTADTENFGGPSIMIGDTTLSPGSTSHTINVPNELTESGDVLINMMCCNAGGATPPTFTAPSGEGTWTSLINVTAGGVSGNRLQFFVRDAGGSEPATESWTTSASADVTAISMILKNCNLEADQDDQSASATETSAAPTCPTITPDNDNSFVVRAICSDATASVDETTYPASVDSAVGFLNSNGALGNGHGMAWAFENQVSAAATGTVDFSTVNDENVALTLAIEALVAAGISIPIVYHHRQRV